MTEGLCPPRIWSRLLRNPDLAYTLSRIRLRQAGQGSVLSQMPTAHAAGSMATIALILRRLMIMRMNIPNRGTQRKAANQGNERNAAKKCQVRQSAAGLVPQMTTER
jgi:hypothetical protein